ncbi:cytochrome P450 monooxygenase [Aspergillus japonicus CBS 114.51]|uniref:Cytochrome P450 monooxygenase n=1 Tax=Aspergillus japonicus CBS 114.51 TaxID=1448312 RepID=A0A8T8XDC9_ASPJA|nr:cytochrome P450 monooxygenase [Aspergillus japonicus CBS 114.51]RAH86030.1 cytochrome P450 monooxygenase [Aspergillus japonicus CBS 114.51]
MILEILGLLFFSYLSWSIIFGRYSRRGWYFADRWESHRRYGPIWAIVTPRDVYVNVADPEAIHDIFQRRTDFIRPSHLYKVLEVYGPCISTASWTDWPRHRKVLATPFNETWDGAAEGQITSVAKDTRTLSLNVLAATGFRKSFPFQSANDHPVAQEPHSTPRKEDADSPVASAGYRDALQTVLDNCIFLMVLGRKWLALPFAPQSWRQIAKAADDFQRYMVRMLDEETKALNYGQAGSGGLMTSFVRAMDLKQKADAEGGTAASGSPPKGLTVDEIFGNIFVINFAGHDTTANTLAFGLLLLAAYPEVQDWVAEELQGLTDEEIKNHYADLFPRLRRCRAILLETLRLFPPIQSLPKRTSSEPQCLQVGGRTIVVPNDVGVHPSLLTMHINAQYWSEAMAWKPSRWITVAEASERVITPARSSFLPWSDGPQNCPGNKFSQVEFVAIMAILLRAHRIDAIANPGESFRETQARVLATTQDVDMQLLLRMKDADRVRMVVRRVA